MEERALVIGAGVAGLSAATTLASHGFRVTLVDRHPQPGGRASTWTAEGFTFDLGPSFYWMPDVIDRYFHRFGARTSDHFHLVRLDPGYRMIFGPGDEWDLPAGADAVSALFEQEESGAAAALRDYLHEAALKYDLGIGDVVYRPSLRWREYARYDLLAGLMRTTWLRSLRTHVRDHFRSARIRQVLEFPSLFLGAPPQRTPALYSLMNHADIALGTWYPMGGMGRLVDALMALAKQQGVEVRPNVDVTGIRVEAGRCVGVDTVAGPIDAGLVVATADYHHVEQTLLPPAYRTYSPAYWERRTMAPATLLFHLGIAQRIPELAHHTLFFDASLDRHSADIHDRGTWPEDPLFYVNATSRTDPSTAPEGMENLMVLVPIASGAADTEALRDAYFHRTMDRLARYVGRDLRPHIRVHRSHGITDMMRDHHAFKGNAYGLANTWAQTGPLRPKVKSEKVAGLYFAGQLTVPGPGLPPALIGGQVVGDLIQREHAR